MHMEQQDFYYVENVSYVMLDQNLKQGKLLQFCSNFLFRGRRYPTYRYLESLCQGKVQVLAADQEDSAYLQADEQP